MINLDKRPFSYQILTGAELPTYRQISAGQEERVQYRRCQNDQGTKRTPVLVLNTIFSV